MTGKNLRPRRRVDRCHRKQKARAPKDPGPVVSLRLTLPQTLDPVPKKNALLIGQELVAVILRQGLADEVKRTVLREATQRFNHELMDDEERQLLLDRIKRLRRALDRSTL